MPRGSNRCAQPGGQSAATGAGSGWKTRQRARWPLGCRAPASRGPAKRPSARADPCPRAPAPRSARRPSRSSASSARRARPVSGASDGLHRQPPDIARRRREAAPRRGCRARRAPTASGSVRRVTSPNRASSAAQLPGAVGDRAAKPSIRISVRSPRAGTCAAPVTSKGEPSAARHAPPRPRASSSPSQRQRCLRLGRGQHLERHLGQHAQRAAAAGHQLAPDRSR